MYAGITGHKGFIGVHLLDALSTCSGITTCEGFDERKYSLLSIESMRGFVEDKDIIYHLAGRMRAPNEDLINVNSLGTLRLVEAIRKYSRRDTKIVFTSSFHVYQPTTGPVRLKESHRLNPLTIYGLSKKFAEEILNRYNSDYGIKSTILRLSNVYGPRCKPFYTSVISTFIELVLGGKPLPVDGDGNQVRDYVYIGDVVRALLIAKDYQSSSAEVFNICSGIPTSVNQLIETLEKLTGRHIVIEYTGLKVSRDFLIGDPTKAQEVMNFRSEVPLKEGLEKTLAWFRGIESSRDPDKQT